MAAPLELILNALEALVKHELEKFKTHLTYVKIEGINPISEGLLENADSTAIAKLIMKNYPDHGGHVMKDVLGKTGRKDLLKWFSDAGPATSSGAKAGGAGPPPTRRVVKPGEKHFADQNRLFLINKVTKLTLILDELLGKDVINQEGYNTVMAASPNTSQDKMRALYTLLQATEAKYVFQEALEKHESIILKELENLDNLHESADSGEQRPYSDDPLNMDIEQPCEGTLSTDVWNPFKKRGPVEDQTKTKREPESGPSSDTTKKSEEELEDVPYDMTKPGYCLNLENETFLASEDRLGTQLDSLKLGRVFSSLGFTVIRCRDKTMDEMVKVLEFFADWDSLKGKNKLIGAEQWSNSDSNSKSGGFTKLEPEVGLPKHGDCFVCCILSHGGTDGICGTDNKRKPVRDIMAFFNGKDCGALLEKPKLFFIQACRGGEIQRKVFLNSDDGGSEEPSDEPPSLPEFADFLLGFANIDQHRAGRHPLTGSWYIQTLCKQLEKGWKRGDDILRILTRVNAAVCKEHDVMGVMEKVGEKLAVVEKEFKQSPGFESYLTKQLIFRRM